MATLIGRDDSRFVPNERCHYFVTTSLIGWAQAEIMLLLGHAFDMIRSRNVASFCQGEYTVLPLLYLLCIWWNKTVEKKEILGLLPANERWLYFVMTSLIGWVQD